MKDTPYEWIYRLYAPYPLHFAIMSKQLNENLTRSKALMLFALNGAHAEGKLSDADYEVLKEKYSVSIEEAKELKSLTLKQIEAQKMKDKDKHNRNRQINRFLVKF